MRVLTFLGSSGLAIALAASPAPSTAPAPVIYLVTMDMHDGDRLVGSPTLKFAAGRQAKVEIGDPAGDLYAISMTARPLRADTVKIESTIEITSAGLHQTVAPNMLIALDKPSAIAIGVESGISKPFRVDFTISKAG